MFLDLVFFFLHILLFAFAFGNVLCVLHVFLFFLHSNKFVHVDIEYLGHRLGLQDV